MSESPASCPSLRSKVADALALADAHGEVAAALHLNNALLALGDQGIAPPGVGAQVDLPVRFRARPLVRRLNHR